MIRVRALLLLIAILGALAVPALAVAQTPTFDVYNTADSNPASDPGTGDDGDGDGDGLPFTGFDIAVVILAGGALLGTGVAIRRGMHSG